MINKLIAKRMGGVDFGGPRDAYKFTRIKRAKSIAQKKNPLKEVIDLGVGEPDKPAHELIVETLRKACGRGENRFYADNGILPFQQSCINFMKDYFKVKGLSVENVIHGIGSKSILAMIPLGVINPGDVTLMTTPGYPILGTHTEYLGGEVYPLPLRMENDFYPNLTDIPMEILTRSKLLYINYPNNPTGQIGTEGFYREVLSFAKRNNILIVSDSAYATLTYDTSPLSILSIPGAMDVAVEIHSLSKSYNMTGWRMAFLVGSKRAIELFGAIKSNTDSGQFRPIQYAAAVALENPQLIELNKNRYSRRMDLLVKTLRNVGFSVKRPGGTFYCYVPSPLGARQGNKEIRFTHAWEAADYIIAEASISTVPWDDAGPFLRLSVTYEAEEGQEELIMKEMERRLMALELIF